MLIYEVLHSFRPSYSSEHLSLWLSSCPLHTLHSLMLWVTTPREDQTWSTSNKMFLVVALLWIFLPVHKQLTPTLLRFMKQIKIGHLMQAFENLTPS